MHGVSVPVQIRETGRLVLLRAGRRVPLRMYFQILIQRPRPFRTFPIRKSRPAWIDRFRETPKKTMLRPDRSMLF